MAKKLMQVARFEGGLNNNSSPTDIGDNEFQELTDVIVSKIGKVTLMGNIASTPATDPPDQTISSLPGRNLFTYDNDRDGDGTVAACHNYVALNNTALRHWDSNDNTWRNIETSLDANGEFDFQIIDGILRYSDGQFANNARGFWGYINRTHFNGTTPGGGAITFSGVIQTGAALTAPVRALVGSFSGQAIAGDATTLNASASGAEFNSVDNEIQKAAAASTPYIGLHSSSANLANNQGTSTLASSSDNNTIVTSTLSASQSWGNTDYYEIYPHQGGVVVDLDINNGSETGTIPDGTYKVGVSFVYDDFQESPIKECGGDLLLSGSDFNYLENIKVKFHANGTSTPGYSPRISGTRVYLRDASDISRSFHLMFDISFQFGYRSSLDSGYEGSWVEEVNFSGYDDLVYISPSNVTSLSGTTYTTINTYGPDEDIDCDYKTSCISNGILYVGNIKQGGNLFPDRMIKCATARGGEGGGGGGVAYDALPESLFIDIATNDGDEIVKLESFSDKVLQFKKKTLYIVIYSDEAGDLVEKEYLGMGIAHPAHAFKTPHGVAFMNKSGCYLYNGQNLVNLTTKIDDKFDRQGVSYASSQPLAGNSIQGRRIPIPTEDEPGYSDNPICGPGEYFNATMNQCVPLNIWPAEDVIGSGTGETEFNTTLDDFTNPPTIPGNWVWNSSLEQWVDTGDF